MAKIMSFVLKVVGIVLGLWSIVDVFHGDAMAVPLAILAFGSEYTSTLDVEMPKA